MRGMEGVWGRRRSRTRREVAVLVLSLALIVAQSVWASGAAAVPGKGNGKGKGAAAAAAAASPITSNQTAVVPGKGNGKGKSAAAAAAATPVTSNQIDAFQGLLAGKDPSLDASWTSGNLCGNTTDCYHELDNVPHRILFKNLQAGTEYTITVLVDFGDQAGHHGYDGINSVVGFANVPGGVSVVQNPDTTNACGTSTTCKSFTFTFTPSDRNAEIRFNAHLALGAHQFGGASLSARLQDIGARNVPLPVMGILLDIRAHKFQDTNGNGVQGAGEPNLAGWSMTLYPGTSCTGSPVRRKDNPKQTDANGNVDWVNVSAGDGDANGDFSVAETLQPGWENTLPGAASTSPDVPCVVVGITAGRNFADFGNRRAPAGIAIEKAGPAVVHVGDTITYTFAVTLTTSTPLTNVTVTDPRCDTAPTLVSKQGGDQDDTLEPGETWNYRCQHVVTATDPDPLPNTATATGTTPNGDQVTDQDSHVVDIIHPAIQIVKTASPKSLSPGETVTYTYVTTNIGDTTLFDVKVTDDKLGHICTVPHPLDPGESFTCTATFEVPELAGPLDNVGTAVGHDKLDLYVTDDETASVVVVLGTTVTPPPTATPPGGIAFTGAVGVVPLAGLALLLLLAGAGILFLTRRRGDRPGA